MALPALIAILALFLPSPALARARPDKLPPSTRLVLDNGFEAILIPNRAAPLVTSVVVVRAGVDRETPASNGISHMLEHLLFNGTARRTQEQIYDELDHHGIINNAHTGAGHTAYFVMATREKIGHALDLQADMLFGSTFPDDKLVKERDIIINEIAKDRVGGQGTMEELYASRLYHPGGLELPIAGTPESVREITRAAIVDYYRAWYLPNNMTAVIMGDFDEEEMAPLVRRYFGAAAPGLLPTPAGNLVNPAALGLSHARRADGTDRLVWLGAAAPGIDAPGAFERAWVLASLLGDDLARAANARLAAQATRGAFLEATVGLDAHAGASTFQVRASLDPSLSWADASRALIDEITARCAARSWRDEDLARIRLEERATLMRLWEKPHYFGMDRAPYIAAAGWDLARDLVRRLSWVEPRDLKELARGVSERKSWAVFMTGPHPPEDAGALSAARAGTVPAAGKPTPASKDLVSGWKGPRATADAATSAATLRARAEAPRSDAVHMRAILPNGLQVSIDRSEDSRVFAAHVLMKNRAAAEPAGRNGIVEMLHRMAGSGTRKHPGASLDATLRAIGGTLKVSDDAGIPYDDIYLSPEYSYIRLEALDEFATEALDLLREILSEPALEDEKALVSARDQLLARARQSETVPRERCRLLLARRLWGETHPFAMPLFGEESTIRSITQADLQAFHQVYFHPRNIIVGIGSSLTPERLLPLVESKLGRWTTGAARGPKAPAAAAVTPGAEPGPQLVTETIESSQAYLMWGRLAPPGPLSEGVLRALAAVLSRRMGDTLREQRGLAYALGADVSTLAGRHQLSASMGVLPAKVEEARAGLREVLSSMISSPPGPREVEDAARATEIRSMMRNLSRINRAWARCIEEMGRAAGGQTATSRGESSTPLTADQVAAATTLMIVNPVLGGWIEAVVAPAPATEGP